MSILGFGDGHPITMPGHDELPGARFDGGNDGVGYGAIYIEPLF